MEIFLIRHGEMAFEEKAETSLELINAYASGSREGPLSERGVRQAECVADRLEGAGLRALYSSAFLRARQTAESTANRLQKSVEVDRDLGEVNVGALIPDRDPGQARFLRRWWKVQAWLPRIVGSKTAGSLLGYALIAFFFRSWQAGKTAGGESPEEAMRRVGEAFDRVEARHAQGESVAVFTHGYYIYLLVNRVIDPAGARRRVLRRPYIRNGSITRLARTNGGRWTVAGYAATDHLPRGDES